ncbi:MULTISPECIES: glycosyltransferase [Bacillaceae]|uniref:glycosyltransferase n=1 Tax=Bacillaceae TaxID=186817 RepID=UPI000BFCE2FA|nr:MULTISPECIES: glycosyltransferase [Bacillaceae]PGT82985.1 glycosyltransferase [Bacillus sp. AFS040349]UGB29483.1 glycosyltransferase [Metabacillus sp. B2-18]
MSKILLLGEYSGVHKNLKEGLVELGHEALVVSGGDGDKNIDSDISITWKSQNKVVRFFELNKILKSLRGYDIVQFINPYLSHRLANLLYGSIYKNNKKTFCLAAGDDVEVFKFLFSGKMKYSPYDEYLSYENFRKSKLKHTTLLDFILQHKFISKQDGIIPIMWEYAESYRNGPYSNKIKNTIPLPINTDKIQYNENALKNKLVFYHASNRPKVKGTDAIVKAMKIFQERYPDDVTMIYADFLPLNEYLEVISKSNVVIDQCKAYTYGMNALYSMAKGKIVMSGAEPEALQELNVQSSPVFNITPDVEQIISQFEYLLNNRQNLAQLGYESRMYVEEVHGYKRIAKQYLQAWSS